MKKRVRTTSAVLSDTGKMRKFNEDSYYISPDENLIIVCDGMGGQVAGGLASKLAVETIKDVYLNIPQHALDDLFPDLDPTLTDTSRKLVSSVRLANRRLYKMATRHPKLRGMGTTVTALTFDESLAIMAHVGDSRIFRLSDGEIVQLTEDHSWLNELIEDKEIHEDDIEHFSKKNVITRALGTSSSIKIDIHCEKYNKDDIYVLSTDGLHNSVTPEDIKTVLMKENGTLPKVTEQLTKKAKRRDGSDNITVALVKIDEGSRSDGEVGVATTVPEEDYTVLAKEDRFLRHRYKDSKVAYVPKPAAVPKKRSRLLYISALLLVTMAAFAVVKTKSLGGGRTGKTATETNGSVQPSAVKAFTVLPQNTPEPTRTEPAALPLPAQPNAQDMAATRSAVIAVMFYGSYEEFTKAVENSDAIILDTLQPYLESDTPPNGDLSLFIVDETNNVLHQTSGIKLPKQNDKKR